MKKYKRIIHFVASKKNLSLVLFVLLLVNGSLSNAQLIATYIGDGHGKYLGSDGPLTEGQMRGTGDISHNEDRYADAEAWRSILSAPGDMAFDTAGNLLIVENKAHRVWKVTPNREITVFAGKSLYKGANDFGGYSGNGGQATAAELSYPMAIATDFTGNVYIAESGRIRKVDPAGIISTIAGNGQNYGYAKDGDLAKNVPVGPIALAVDAGGNIYFADGNTSRILKINSGGIISTVVGKIDNMGNGKTGFSGDGGPASAAAIGGTPNGMAFDSSGNLYFLDAANYRVRKINKAGIITTIAGNGNKGERGYGGPPLNAEFFSLNAIAIGDSGKIFIADGANRVLEITPDGIIKVIVGDGKQKIGYDDVIVPGYKQEIDKPTALALDKWGNLYMNDNSFPVIYKLYFHGSPPKPPHSNISGPARQPGSTGTTTQHKTK